MQVYDVRMCGVFLCACGRGASAHAVVEAEQGIRCLAVSRSTLLLPVTGSHTEPGVRLSLTLLSTHPPLPPALESGLCAAMPGFFFESRGSELTLSCLSPTHSHTWSALSSIVGVLKGVFKWIPGALFQQGLVLSATA